MKLLKKLIEITTLELHKELPIDVLIKLFITNLLSLLIMASAIIFVFVSINNGAIYLAYFLLGLIIIHIFNFMLYIWKKNINISKLITVLSVELLFIILIFNGGAIGYGYLWFYGFPIITMFILGRKKGNLINISFFLIIFSLLFIPKTIISIEYNNSLVFRILISYFIISSILYIMHTINDKVIYNLRKKLKDNNNVYEENNKLFLQLANESKNTFNNIISITNKINKNKSKNIDIGNIELLQNSTINLVNIMNNIVELSEYKIRTSALKPIGFNIIKTIDNTIQIFKSRNFEIKVNYSENIPTTIKGNPARIKQVIFNILNSISKRIEIKNKININVETKSNIDKNVYLRFKIEVNQNLLKEKAYNKTNENNILLSSIKDYIEELELTDTNKTISKTGGYLFIDNTIKSTTIKFACNFNKTNIEENKLNEIILQEEIKVEEYNNFTESKMKKMKILFVDNNLLNKKLAEIELKNKMKKIEFANSYKEAIDKFTKNSYGIVIINNKIDNIYCYSFLKKINELEYSIEKKSKIIIIDTNDPSLNKTIIQSYGITGYCDKNFNANSIINTINHSIFE